MIRNSDNEINFPCKLLLTNRQVENFRKAFANYLSIDIKSSKTQLSKTIQSRVFFCRLFWSIIKNRITINKGCN